MWLVVGLGNPGRKYERNRHNIGFRVVDELARRHGLPAWKPAASRRRDHERRRSRPSAAASGRTAQADGVHEPLRVRGAADGRSSTRSTSTDILVVHDEIDLDLGVVRLKRGGGHGGHNGLRSIIEQLGERRLRAAARWASAASPSRPAAAGAKDAAGWVLADFPAAQAPRSSAMIAAGARTSRPSSPTASPGDESAQRPVPISRRS